MGKLSLSKMVCIVCVFCAATAIASPAQTFTTLVAFDITDGSGPGYMPLIQGTDGNFYGTTFGGGYTQNCPYGCGTVFKISPQYPYALTTLYSFCTQTNCTDGSNPLSALVQATDGNFYGTTSAGGGSNNCGSSGCGTVFKMTPRGTLTTLHSFDGTNGAGPWAGLVQGTDGNFYGTALGGGAYTYGTVFRITPGGALTTLHSFDWTDGSYLYGGLVQATDGNFYGTTSDGGANDNCTYGCGTVFRITPGGTLTTLHNFDGSDGATSLGTLVQATDGNLYGTTQYGGTSNNCSGSCGTVFKMTLGGTLTTLHSFDSSDGSGPVAGLVQATDGNFYGTTQYGGTNGYGTAYKITPGGTLTNLHSFDIFSGGLLPHGGLLQATNGTFYGTTSEGGEGWGVVFSLSLGFGPFVATQPTSGGVGTPVIILGTNLTGSTRVTFNGTEAAFNVVPPSEITTTVPAGASTGIVQVTTPGGVLSSNVPFGVTPSILNFLPRLGRVGTSVVITGGSLTGATSVTFEGVQARNFTVESPTEIRATVPEGARTGKIGVTTPGGTATSAGTFRVL